MKCRLYFRPVWKERRKCRLMKCLTVLSLRYSQPSTSLRGIHNCGRAHIYATLMPIYACELVLHHWDVCEVSPIFPSSVERKKKGINRNIRHLNYYAWAGLQASCDQSRIYRKPRPHVYGAVRASRARARSRVYSCIVRAL